MIFSAILLKKYLGMDRTLSGQFNKIFKREKPGPCKKAGFIRIVLTGRGNSNCLLPKTL